MTLIIPHRAIVKKNTKRVYGRNVVYSTQFRTWNGQAILSLRRQWSGKQPLEGPLEMEITFFFENRQGEADLSNLVEGPQDALKSAGIIIDDKYIHILKASKIFGQAEARTEIVLRQL